MRWWERSIGGAMRGRIIALLRRGERTVDELSAELGVTDNAVRAHVDLLEREGIVAQARVRRDGAVGKPATLYSIAPRANATLSAAYAPVLTALAASLRERMPRRDLEALYRDAGRRLAEGQGESGARGFEKRVRDAAEALAHSAPSWTWPESTMGSCSRDTRVHSPTPSERIRPSAKRSENLSPPSPPNPFASPVCDGESPKCRLEIRRSA